MRNLLVIFIAAAITSVAFADFTDLDAVAYQGKTKIKQANAAIDANFEMVKAQADTNATTTATLYTPDFVGQALVGGAGTGTNAAWIAKGVTTNDWVQIAP